MCAGRPAAVRATGDGFDCTGAWLALEAAPQPASTSAVSSTANRIAVEGIARVSAIVDVDELYGLPLDRFVAERTALARALRTAGDRDEAARVAALRKPSVAAWAVNQLVRTQGKALQELFDAGDSLRDAQTDLLAGRGERGDLRAATEREREAVNTLLQAARGLLSSDGHELGPAIVERVSDSLHAAALGDEAREEVGAGRLERELRHVGLGMDAGGGPEPVRRKQKTPATKAKPAPPQAKTAPAKAKPAREPRAVAKEQAEARRAARIAEAEARRHLDLTTRALRAARERRDRAAEALAEADVALEYAAAEHEKAKAAVKAH
jgi:hypothetical protein